MSRHTITLTKAQAEKFFMDFKGCSLVTFFYKKECDVERHLKGHFRARYGRVYVIERMKMNFGIEYQKSVEKKSNDGTYDNDGLPDNMRYKAYKKVLTNLNTNDTLIRTYVVRGTNVSKKYIVYGRFATRKETDLIKTYEKPYRPYVCKKQLAKGIVNNQTQVRNLLLDNIIGFRVNGFTYRIV